MTTRKGEVGRIGQKRYGGVFYEEFLPELRGRRGMAAYSEMAANDDLVGAILYAIKMLIRQVDWTWPPAVLPRKTRKPRTSCWNVWPICKTPGRTRSAKFCPS